MVRPPREAKTSSSLPHRPTSVRATRISGLEEKLLADPRHHTVHAFTRLKVCEQERLLPSHHPRVTVHDLEIRADIRRKIGFVDDKQIRPRDSRTSLARNLVASRDIDDIDRRIHKLRTETRC